MTTLENTSSVQLDAQPLTKTQARNVRFHRILVRRDGETKHTTVCVSERIYAVMLRFAYGRMEGVNGVLRRAALLIKNEAPGQFSHLVRLKALAMLRGAYRPPMNDAAQRLAEVNNAAWSANG